MTLLVVSLSVAALVLAFAGAGAVLVVVLRGSPARNRGKGRTAETPQRPAESPFLVELAAKVAALEVQVSGLPSLWESERKRAESEHAKARAARSYAEKLRAEVDGEGEDDDDDDGWEDDDVLPIDAGRSTGGGMLAVQEGLGGGVTDDIRRKARELGFL